MIRRSTRPLVFGLALAITFWSVTAMSDAPSTQVRSFRLEAPLARVFPLFTALGERTWAPGWDPELLSGQNERGAAFRTVNGDRETTWIVTDYRPSEGRVSYARLARDSNIGLVDVRCRSVEGGTEVSVRYTLTGLNAGGRAFVQHFLDPANYTRMIEEWRAATSGALAVNN